TGQPLHAYDYDKVLNRKKGIGNREQAATLGVRLSKKGEKLRLLGGKDIELDDGAVVITDGLKPIGLGGVMGGADTEVDKNTKNIIFECANFDMNLTRKTAMAYGLFTDAATRFTKNQNPRQNRAVLVKTVQDTLQLVGGRVASPLIDDKHFQETDIIVNTDSTFINQRLGTSLSAVEIKKLLENVEFKVSVGVEKISVTAPFWRTDIEIPEDIVEEVGRLYGYDKMPQNLPRRTIAPAAADKLLDFKARLRDILAKSGANEVLTYSFVHGTLMQKSGQNPAHAYHIRNALSPDLQYYRQSLTPSLLEKVHPNLKAGFEEFALYEIGKGHVKELEGEDKLPQELERLSLVVASKAAKPGAAYFAAKTICDYLLQELSIHTAKYVPLSGADGKTVTYYDDNRVANIKLKGQTIGRIGEYKASVRTALKLPQYCAGFELHTEELLNQQASVEYQPLNRFPELEQDLCLRSSAELSYQELTDFLTDELAKIGKRLGYIFRLEPLDIYQKQGDKHSKQTTWRIILSHSERTLTTKEANKALEQLALRAKNELKAERI
ncbi:MAG TPA: phenylalanine--tRNA ligase subunit beta, partial [Candidatus Saccharimonadales bacterium]|nr:phenylalanine--tRNA ligase subunit beta [Candidatus Saccharimonadales bacterium]